MKKIVIYGVSIFVIMAIALSTLGVMAGNKASKPIITVESISGVPGERIAVKLMVTDNPGFAAMAVTLSFNKNMLTPVSVSGGGVLQGATVVSNIQQGGDMKRYDTVSLFSVSPTNFKGDGGVFTVIFDLSDAASGEIPLKLSYREGDIANQELDDVHFDIVDGCVSIKNQNAQGKPPSSGSGSGASAGTKPNQTQNKQFYQGIAYSTLVNTGAGEINAVTIDQSPITTPFALNLTGGTKISGLKVRDKNGAACENSIGSVEIGDGVGKIVGSFNGWSSLKNVVVPKSVTQIEQSFEQLDAGQLGIYGVIGSYAQVFADQKGYTFHELITVTLDGSKLFFDQPAWIKNDRALVPMRGIFEALGAVVYWDGATKTVTAMKGDTAIQLQIGKKEILIDQNIVNLDVAAEIQNGRTMVPVRAISEGLKADVDWNNDKRTVVIKTK